VGSGSYCFVLQIHLSSVFFNLRMEETIQFCFPLTRKPFYSLSGSREDEGPSLKPTNNPWSIELSYGLLSLLFKTLYKVISSPYLCLPTMLKNLRQRVDLFNFLRGDAGTKQVHLSLRTEQSTMTNHKKNTRTNVWFSLFEPIIKRSINRRDSRSAGTFK